jgi:hypothetical protein
MENTGIVGGNKCFVNQTGKSEGMIYIRILFCLWIFRGAMWKESGRNVEVASEL